MALWTSKLTGSLEPVEITLPPDLGFTLDSAAGAASVVASGLAAAVSVLLLVEAVELLVVELLLLEAVLVEAVLSAAVEVVSSSSSPPQATATIIEIATTVPSRNLGVSQDLCDIHHLRSLYTCPKFRTIIKIWA